MFLVQYLALSRNYKVFLVEQNVICNLTRKSKRILDISTFTVLLLNVVLPQSRLSIRARVVSSNVLSVVTGSILMAIKSTDAAQKL